MNLYGLGRLTDISWRGVNIRISQFLAQKFLKLHTIAIWQNVLHRFLAYKQLVFFNFSSLWLEVILIIMVASDQSNIRFVQTVRPKWQHFFLKKTELSFCITFNDNGILSYFHFAWWPTCNLGRIAKRMPIEPKLE